MSRRMLLSLLLCAAAVTATVAHAADDPVAFLVALKGRIDVTPSGSKHAERASLGRPLLKGDRLQVANGGAGTLFFNDGNVIELAEKSAITVTGKVTAKKPSGPSAEAAADVFKSVSKSLVGGSREAGLVALAPMRGTEEERPLIIAPRRTELIDAHPAFAWRTLDGAARYRLIVSGDDGEVWRAEVQGTTLDYPTTAPALAPGVEYRWELSALSERGTLLRDETVFRILPLDDATQVRAHLDHIEDAAGGGKTEAGRFLAGSYLAGRGLYRDAQENFQALCALTPDAPGPHEALGNVYRAVGLTDLAAAEYQKAQVLAREP